MGLLSRLRSEFIDVIEWHEDGTDTLVWRFPRDDNAIKTGAHLIVREGQHAVFVCEGQVVDQFGPGRHQLTTRNLPLLTTLLAWPTAFESPFKADVFFVSLRCFTDIKWGTRHPLLLRDPELGPVRIRGFGSFCVEVTDPGSLIRHLNGNNAVLTLHGIQEQMRNLVVSRLADQLGETMIPVLDLASSYDEIAATLGKSLCTTSDEFGLVISKLLIESLTLPPEVEAAIDRRASIALSGDLAAFRAYQEGIALEQAATNPGGLGAAGAGLAMGFALGGRLSPPANPPAGQPNALPSRNRETPEDA